MSHNHLRPLRFYTLSCPDCGGPLINYDGNGVEYILSFRNQELAKLEAADMAEEDGTPEPSIMEVELSVIPPTHG